MKKITLHQVGETFEHLHNSEIEVEVSSTWNEGFEFKLGHFGKDKLPNGGPKSPTFLELVNALAFQACINYPNSDFAIWYADLPNA